MLEFVMSVAQSHRASIEREHAACMRTHIHAMHDCVCAKNICEGGLCASHPTYFCLYLLNDPPPAVFNKT